MASTFIERLLAYVPPDRAAAILGGASLPENDQGALLFSDISGFTPLTEAVIAKYGPREGGEHFTDRLNAVYDTLITEVLHFGGNIVGFAGDAMTVWFSGDDGRRAVTAALAMQKGMQQHASVSLPDGETVSLAMKVAVATGAVKRLRVGDPGIQNVDVIAGPVTELVSACEGLAQRGEIVVSEATAANLGADLSVAGWRALPGSEGRAAVVVGLASPSPHAEVPALPLPDDAAQRLLPWLLPEVGRRLQANQEVFLTELRPATALFAHFSGIDFNADPEAATKLDVYVRWIQAVVSRLEGTLIQLTLGEKGSYLYAAWGAPIAHDDDTMRACTAALQIVQPPPEIARLITQTHVGVTTGTMRTGAYGNRKRSTYGILGDDTNLAARLMSKAGPNEILVSAAAYRREADTFDFQELPAITVKGKREPIPVFRLKGRRQSGLLGALRDTPLVGRRQECALMLERLHLAKSGKGQVISLSADAGMGKTRLLSEVVRLATEAGFTPFAGDCPALGRDASYSAWVPLFRAFLRIPAETTPERALAFVEAQLSGKDTSLRARAPLLGPLLHLPFPDNELTASLDAKVRRSSMEGLVVECVRRRTRNKPVLFILEECHWIDEASRNLLSVLAQAAPRLRFAIIITHRPVKPGEIFSAVEQATGHHTLVELGDLPPDEARQLIELRLADALGGTAPPGWLVDVITSRAGGNPFFIEEVAMLLRGRGAALQDPRSLDSLDLPESLHSLALSRIDQLSENAQTSLKVASVIGRLFHRTMLLGVHPLSQVSEGLEEQLREMVARDLALPEPVEGDDAYLFRHMVLQEAAYQSLPSALRAVIHEAIGTHIESSCGTDTRSFVDLLAFHFSRSHRLDKKRLYLVAAADSAKAAYSLQSAIRYYERALELLTGSERVEVLARFGEVLELAGRWGDAFSRYTEGRDLSERYNLKPLQALLAGLLGDLHRKRGEFAAAEKWLEQARREYEALGNASGVALMHHLEATLNAQQGRFTQAAGLYQQALALREQIGEEAAMAKTLNNLAIVSRSQGDSDTALRYYERSLEIRRRLTDRREIANSLNNLGFALRFRGDFARAKELLEESVRLNRDVGDRWSTANALTSLAELALDTSDAALARQCLVESITINRDLGDRRSLAFLLEGFGRLCRLKNEAASALLFFEAASRLRSSIGAPLEPADAKKLEAVVSETRSVLDPEAISRVEAEAKTLPFTEVLERTLAS